MTDEQLEALIADDDLGLLIAKPKRTPQTTEEERLLESFQDILRFVAATGAAPTRLGTGLHERRLYSRLVKIRLSPHQCERLKPFDEHGLLTPLTEAEEPLLPDEVEAIQPDEEEAAPVSIEDLLNDPFFDEVETDASDIFNLKHVPARKDLDSADYVAQRKPCKDFQLYEEQFIQCQKDLKDGRRRLLPFANEQHIEVGKFFVLRGVLLLVVEMGERAEMKGRTNSRLRCVFENGTEGDLLLRSLSSQLYKKGDGMRVSELDANLMDEMLVTEEDKSAGYIYVLRSLSQHPDILSIPNLYKIGLARMSIETRIQNAVNEPTYLMAPVSLVSSFQCYNVNLTKMENLLHRFFEAAIVKVQVKNLEGNYFTPQEWFSVPLEAVETAVRLLISGEIVHYRYDADAEQVELAE
ncbi:MAG TPA: hypothetical protein DCP71_00655 [Verrucomicrobiales bacterium]|nr:hypothetical protein [Verrucomicrobiales bacterium]